MWGIAACMARFWNSVFPWYWTRGWVRRYRVQDFRESLKNFASLHTEALLDGTVLTASIKFYLNHTHFVWNKRKSVSKPKQDEPPASQLAAQGQAVLLKHFVAHNSTQTLPWGGRLGDASVTGVQLGKVSYWQRKNNETSSWTGSLVLL